MTIDVRDLTERLREFADQAARQARDLRQAVDELAPVEAEFQSGRHAAFLTAIRLAKQLEDEAAAERDANIRNEEIGEEAARLGVIGYGQGVDLGAVERLEEFARSAGGSVDMASGTVHSDADAGL